MLTTRVKTNCVGYDGINLYLANGTYLGEVIVMKSSQHGAELSINIPALTVKPKAIDPEDEAHIPLHLLEL